eukprot:GFUD01011710.1.p1 GENE.GFUD01011710.1~~GFUD01011710.1.p1  ORF type:complete len:400 (+),score=91.68 GFUD01011710.1:31-1200(+)
MLGLFSGLKDFVPIGKKTGSPQTEGVVAKLHYRATTLLILGCCVLVTALDWIGNGNSIACIMEGDSDSWTIPPNVINTYCYIMSTFTLPSQLAGSVGHDVAAPGVGTYNHKTGDVTFKAYYQWVPFVLFMQACLFYAPHLLCKMWEGGKITGIISGLNAMVIDRSERKDKQRIVAQYLVDTLHTHNIWTIKMFITEIIYFLNVLGNIYFMDVFLGGEFRTYGLQVASIVEEDPEDRVDPMSRIFPRVTKCTFNKFGPSGSIQRRDAMCVLPVNIINEKIYVFLWFWLTALVIITGLSLLHSAFLLAAPSVRNMMLRSRAAHQGRVLSALDDVTRRLHLGDWKLLHILGMNMEPLVFGELVVELAEQMKDGNHNRVEHDREQTKTLLTQI